MPAEFEYTTQRLEAIKLTLSPVRLGKYIEATKVNGEERLIEAIKLYEYNTRLGEAFYGLLKDLEICLRNAINRTMTADEESPGVPRGPFWFDTNYVMKKRTESLLFPGEAEDILKARNRLREQGKTELADSIVALLSLGFWVMMTDSKYERRLWYPSELEKAFPNYQARTGRQPERQPIYNRLNNLRQLRNKVAHHEPVFAYNANQVLEAIFETMDWMCIHTANWARARVWLPKKPDF